METLKKFLPLPWFFNKSPALPEINAENSPARFRGLVKKNNYREKDNLTISELEFVVLDTETTGFKPQAGDEIISVGACTLKGNVLLPEHFHKMVNPYRTIPPVVSELTGIYDRHVADADSFCDVISNFLDYLGDKIIIGHAVDFDINFINHKLKPYNVKINNHYIDTSLLSKALNTDLRVHTLDCILSHMCIEPQGRHTALGDALLTADIYIRFLNRLDELNIKTLWDLRSFIRHSILYVL